MRLPSKISTMRLLFLSCLLSVVCDAFVQTSGSGTSLLTLSARISLLREADRSFTPSKGNTKFTTKMVLVNGESDFENLPYRELQHIAKANHIRANQPVCYVPLSLSSGHIAPCFRPQLLHFSLTWYYLGRVGAIYLFIHLKRPPRTHADFCPQADA